MWLSGVCHVYTSLTGEVKSLLDANFSNCFQNSINFQTLKLHSPQPVIEIFLASSKQAPFSKAEIFLLLLCRQQSDALYLHLQTVSHKLELTVFSLLGAQHLLRTEGFYFVFNFSTFFITNDKNECNVLLCTNRTSFIYTAIREASELWTCTQVCQSQQTTVPLWWVPNTVVTQNLHDKEIKKYL